MIIKLLRHKLAKYQETTETAFLFQCLAMAIQRFNADAFCKTFVSYKTICDDKSFCNQALNFFILRVPHM